MFNKSGGESQKCFNKIAFLSGFKQLMSFNKLFITFLIKYYRNIISALHHETSLKSRETSHWIQETSVCSQVTSVWIKVSSVQHR